MASNVIFFGWNKALVGREKLSDKHFKDFNKYLAGLQKARKIEGYDIVFLDPHGGDLNGFFLIRGKGPDLDAVMAGEEWGKHMIRAITHLDGAGAIRGTVGDASVARMDMWRKALPGK